MPPSRRSSASAAPAPPSAGGSSSPLEAALALVALDDRPRLRELLEHLRTEQAKAKGKEKEKEEGGDDSGGRSKTKRRRPSLDFGQDGLRVDEATREVNMKMEKETFTVHEGKRLGWLDMRDRYGNTPLSLACFLRHFECAQILVEEGGASVMRHTSRGWSCFNLSLSSCDAKLAAYVYRKGLEMVREEYYERRRYELLKALEALPDFYLELRWQFRSWIPLVSRLAPSDTYKIWKRGSQLRVDLSLLGFENKRWKRGNLTVLFVGRDRPQTRSQKKRAQRKARKAKRQDDAEGEQGGTDAGTGSGPIPGAKNAAAAAGEDLKHGRLGDLLMLDHDAKVVEHATKSMSDISEKEIAEEISTLLESARLVQAHSDANVEHEMIERGRSITDFFKGSAREPKMEEVAGFSATQYKLKGFEIAVDIRENHRKNTDDVSAEGIFKRDLPRHYQRLAKRAQGKEIAELVEGSRDKSEHDARLSEHSKKGELLHKYETESVNKKSFEGTAWMVPTEEFGHDIQALMPVFQALSPSLNHLDKLSKVIPKLPPGFPVRLDIPLFRIVTGAITFDVYEEFDEAGQPTGKTPLGSDLRMEGQLFEIPSDYETGQIQFAVPLDEEELDLDDVKAAIKEHKERAEERGEEEHEEGDSNDS